MDHKECRVCREVLPLAEFAKRTATTHRNECRACKRRNSSKEVELQCAPEPRVLILLNNAFNLWQHPADRSQPLRPIP